MAMALTQDLAKEQILSVRGGTHKASSATGHARSSGANASCIHVNKQKPCHRKCDLCIRFDDDWDPVTLKVFARKEYTWWVSLPSRG